MNEIIHKHYPVDRLPADLRPRLPSGSHVTVTVSEEAPTRRPLSVDEAVALMRKIQVQNGGNGLTPEEAALQVRALRDEWD